MFIAEMWEFGKDSNCVGVDGIITCMGVFVLYDNKLFAIHQPHSSVGINKQGRDAFVAYFMRKNPGYDGGAKICAVVNGTPRTGAEDEVREFQRLLDAETTIFIRITGVEDSIAIVCERDPLADGINLKYKKHSEAGWISGSGKKRAGYYKNDIGDHKYAVASTDGWAPIVKSNAQIISLDVRAPNRSKKKCLIM
jgi:hypothetical protein